MGGRPVLGAWSLETGLTADLVNRAAELLVIGPVGGAALLWLGRRLARSRDRRGTPTGSSD
ncbi:MAG: hypothetical protein ACYTJ0_18655 [Planctomycetota bacterium]